MRSKVCILGITATLTVLAGCSVKLPHSEETRPIISAAVKKEMTDPVPYRTSAYIRTYSAYGKETSLPVRVGGLPLRQVLEIALPGYEVLPQDAYVDMDISVKVATDAMQIEDFLKQIGTVTGYDIHADGHDIKVSGFATKEWLLPMLATKTTSASTVSGASAQAGQVSGVAQGQAASVTRNLSSSFDDSVNEWPDLIKNVTDIVAGYSGSHPPQMDGSSSSPAPTKTQIISNRSQGLIRVFAPVPAVAAVDKYLTGVLKTASRQVRLDVRALDVTLTDTKATGINWSAALNTLLQDSRGIAGITIGNSFPIQASTAPGSFTLGATETTADATISSMVTLLSNYGTVELRNEPQITTLNGRPAYIGSGTEFGYVASIETTVSNGAVVANPTLQRILVGIELQITPRMLDANRIMLEVVPVISTLQSFDSFTVGQDTFSQPRIVLNQMASNVITTSGRPVELGGLITDSISKSLNSLPIANQGILQALDPIFGAEDNALTRRELLLVVTPYAENS